MYEFNGWAVVRSDEGTSEADGELMDRLLECIEGLPDTMSPHYHTGGHMLNGYRSILASGLRNHPSDVMSVFGWLAEQGRRCYGLLYVRDAERGTPNRFDVWRLQDGKLTRHDDPFFT